MKKITIILFFLSLNSFSQKHIIKTNPILDGIKFYNLGYELKVSEKNSAQITIYNLGFSNFNGYAISGEYRMYFKEALKGWFWGPNFNFIKAKSTSKTDAIQKYRIYSLNAEIGYQWFLSKKITFDCLIGLGYHLNYDAYDKSLWNHGIGGIIAFSFGYNF